MYFDKRLPQDYEDLLRQYEHSPHCDAAVLHAPGICQVCDRFPLLQAYRDNYRINFTGLPEPSGTPCWSEVTRPITLIEKWVGNRIAEYPAPKAGGGG